MLVAFLNSSSVATLGRLDCEILETLMAQMFHFVCCFPRLESLKCLFTVLLKDFSFGFCYKLFQYKQDLKEGAQKR